MHHVGDARKFCQSSIKVLKCPARYVQWMGSGLKCLPYTVRGTKCVLLFAGSGAHIWSSEGAGVWCDERQQCMRAGVRQEGLWQGACAGRNAQRTWHQLPSHCADDSVSRSCSRYCCRAHPFHCTYGIFHASAPPSITLLLAGSRQ